MTGSARPELFGQLLERGRIAATPSFASWSDALSDALERFFEVHVIYCNWVP
jgi:hypothetical protein